MLKSINNSRAFISIFLLLFALIFLLSTLKITPHTFEDLTIIQITNTKKQSEFLNIERVIENTLKKTEDIHKVNNNIVNYTNKSFANFHIENQITKKKEKVSSSSLFLISKVIVFKPAKHISVRTYILTNGISKNKLFAYDIKTNNYITHFYFPKNYSVTQVVYE
jgi:hypothetical protein